MSSLQGLKRKYGASKFSVVSGKKLVLAGMGRRNRFPKVKGPIRKARELKFVDTSATYAFDTTGTITLINGVAVGDDYNTRDGRQVTIKSVQLHGLVQPSDDLTSYSKVRLLMVWDNATNSALPAITDILTAANGLAFPLVNNQSRFTILMDKSFTLGKVDSTATQAFAASQTCFDIEGFVRINQITQFNGTAATISNIQNGGLYLVSVGTGSSTLGGTGTVNARVRFTDD